MVSSTDISQDILFLWFSCAFFTFTKLSPFPAFNKEKINRYSYLKNEIPIQIFEVNFHCWIWEENRLTYVIFMEKAPAPSFDGSLKPTNWLNTFKGFPDRLRTLENDFQPSTNLLSRLSLAGGGATQHLGQIYLPPEKKKKERKSSFFISRTEITR